MRRKWSSFFLAVGVFEYVWWPSGFLLVKPGAAQRHTTSEHTVCHTYLSLRPCVFVRVCVRESRRVVADCQINNLVEHFSTGLRVCASLIGSQAVHQKCASECFTGERKQSWIVAYHFRTMPIEKCFSFVVILLYVGYLYCLYAFLNGPKYKCVWMSVKAGWLTLRKAYFQMSNGSLSCPFPFSGLFWRPNYNFLLSDLANPGYYNTHKHNRFLYIQILSEYIWRISDNGKIFSIWWPITFQGACPAFFSTAFLSFLLFLCPLFIIILFYITLF